MEEIDGDGVASVDRCGKFVLFLLNVQSQYDSLTSYSVRGGALQGEH